MGLPADAYPELLEALASAGLTGGAVYDALVAASAQHAGATLLSLDVRAATTYRAIGADCRLVR